MRILTTVITYLFSLVITAVVAFYVVIFLAGPHAGLLPSGLEVVVIILGWLAVLILPLSAARKVWRRHNKIVS